MDDANPAWKTALRAPLTVLQLGFMPILGPMGRGIKKLFTIMSRNATMGRADADTAAMLNEDDYDDEDILPDEQSGGPEPADSPLNTAFIASRKKRKKK